MTATDQNPLDQITIQRVTREVALIPIRGTAPLIVHNWSAKAKRKMLDSQQGKRNLKENRDPAAEYRSALYRIEDPISGETRYGFPAIAFKQAAVSAGRYLDKSVPMTSLRQAMFFAGVLTPADPQKLVPIIGEPKMREDVIGLPRNGTDLRYRAEFTAWSATLEVTFVSSILDQSSVVSLVEAAGFGVGIGEWRPEKKGDYGTFEVDPTRPIDMVLQS